MRNLLGRLLQRPPADLERIADFWAVELRGSDRHADVSFLYRTMTDIWAVRDAWERIPASGGALVRALERHEGAALPVETLATEAGLEPGETRAALRLLHDAGIIAMGERGQDEQPAAQALTWFLPREMGMMVERVEAERAAPSPGDQPLDELLAAVPYPELEEAANAWGARVIPALHARAELVGILREQLARPERVDALIAALSAPARNAWARLKQAGGVIPLDDLLSPRDVPLIARRRIVRELAAPLLLWHGYDVDGRRLAVVPQAILHPPPITVEPPPELRFLEHGEVVEPEWSFPFAAAWDMLTTLREVAVTVPRWKPLAEADPAILRRLRRRLWSADRESLDVPAGYVQFLVQTGALAGLLREDPRERAVLSDAARTWREQAFAPAQARLVAAWLGAEEWIEGRERVDTTIFGAAWPRMRETLLRALGELEEGRWVDEGRFVERLLKAEPDLLRQAQAVAAGRRRGLEAPAGAQERRAQLLTLVLGTTLETACTWLGLIERGHERETDRPTLRLTPFGRWMVGKRVEPQLPSQGDRPLEVGAGFQVLLYRPTPRRVWALSAFCELQTLDKVSTWTLTAEALVRALAGGLDLEQVTTFLERQNGGPLPKTVAATLAEWDRGYRRVWLRRAVVLVPEQGEESVSIAGVLKEAGLEPDILPDGRIALVYDEPEAGERLIAAATRALRERGFAPLADPHADGKRR